MLKRGTTNLLLFFILIIAACSSSQPLTNTIETKWINMGYLSFNGEFVGCKKGMRISIQERENKFFVCKEDIPALDTNSVILLQIDNKGTLSEKVMLRAFSETSKQAAESFAYSPSGRECEQIARTAVPRSLVARTLAGGGKAWSAEPETWRLTRLPARCLAPEPCSGGPSASPLGLRPRKSGRPTPNSPISMCSCFGFLRERTAFNSVKTWSLGCGAWAHESLPLRRRCPESSGT